MAFASGEGGRSILHPGKLEKDPEWVKVTFNGGHDVFMSRETMHSYVPLSMVLECKTSGLISSQSRDKCMTGDSLAIRRTVQDLPDEMLSEILSCLPTMDLLKRCRLVNRNWKNLSSQICRKRFVGLRRWWEKDERKPDDIFTLFDLENLPWSSYSLRGYTGTAARKQKFIEVFGQHLWGLELCEDEGEVEVKEENYEKTLAILQQTPNLRRLYISTSGRVWNSNNLSGIGDVSLRSLNHLRMDSITDGNMELLTFLVVGCGARLNYFEASVKFTRVEYAEIFAVLMTDVLKISLAIDYTPSMGHALEVLAKKQEGLKLRKLHLYLEDSYTDFEGSFNYEPIEHFLAAHSGCLKKLTVECEVRLGVNSIPFNFPFLPALRSLNIVYDGFGSGTNFVNGFLSLLTTNQFPILKELEIQESVASCAKIRFFPTTCQFDSVSEFTINTLEHVLDEWSNLFPNLTDLETTIYNDSESLLRIFSCKNLKHLVLSVAIEDPPSINSLLSGIPNPDAVYLKSSEEIAQEKLLHGLPSLTQLTKLRTLEIQFDPCGDVPDDKLRDPGAYLSLLQLQPLDYLKVFYVEISEECKAKLLAHHHSFECQDD